MFEPSYNKKYSRSYFILQIIITQPGTMPGVIVLLQNEVIPYQTSPKGKSLQYVVVSMLVADSFYTL